MRISDWSSDVCPSDLWTAGAEANVATALALLGHDVAFATALPQNALGDAAIQSLRGHGVDCRRVIHREGRMGLYFVTRSEEHTSELQSLMRISYAVFCLKKKNNNTNY